MQVFVKKTAMLVTNVNPRKEGSGDNMALASDVKVSFQAPRSIMDRLVPDHPSGKFSDQFYGQDGDVRLAFLFPISFHQKLNDMKALFYFGKKAIDLSPAKVTGIKMTPTAGGYVDIECTIQVNPDPAQSGKLDSVVKEVIDVEIHALTGDLIDAGAETSDNDGAEAA